MTWEDGNMGALVEFKSQQFLNQNAVFIPATGQAGVINIGISPALRRRRIYLYAAANASIVGSLGYCFAYLRFWRLNNIAAELPADIIVNPTVIQGNCRATIATGGGYPVADGITITLDGNQTTAQVTGEPTGANAKVALQPQTIDIDADRVTIDIWDLIGIAGIRYWLGVMSF